MVSLNFSVWSYEIWNFPLFIENTLMMIWHLTNAGDNILTTLTVFQHRFDSPQVKWDFLSTVVKFAYLLS